MLIKRSLGSFDHRSCAFRYVRSAEKWMHVRFIWTVISSFNSCYYSRCQLFLLTSVIMRRLGTNRTLLCRTVNVVFTAEVPVCQCCPRFHYFCLFRDGCLIRALFDVKAEWFSAESLALEKMISRWPRWWIAWLACERRSNLHIWSVP